jgi:hypothetical protein
MKKQTFDLNNPKALGLIQGDTITIKAVAVVCKNNHWAAFWGASEKPNDDVLAKGILLSQPAASEIFPLMERAGLKYVR